MAKATQEPSLHNIEDTRISCDFFLFKTISYQMKSFKSAIFWVTATALTFVHSGFAGMRPVKARKLTRQGAPQITVISLDQK